MKRNVILGIASCLIFISTQLSAQSSTNLTPIEFNAKLKEPNVVLIDVRTNEELAEGMIKDAMQIDYTSKEFKSNLLKLDKTKTYLLYCAVGGRSNQGVKILTEQGIKAYNLKGGITAWKEQKLPVVKK